MTRKLLKDDNEAKQERPWAETIATIADQTGHSPSVHQCWNLEILFSPSQTIIPH